MALSWPALSSMINRDFVWFKCLLYISEKKRYRESYISDDLDLDPHGSESSPGLSRRSTSSSGIEADARQHSISTEITSMEEDCHQPVEKRLSSAASCASSSTSGFEAGSKAQAQDDGWKEEGVHPHMPCVSLCVLWKLVLQIFFGLL